IDPLTEFADGYAEHRPRTRFFSHFVSDHSGEFSTVHIGANSWFTSQRREHVDGFTEIAGTLEVSTITLDDLLEREEVEQIDFLSIDIELHEPEALAGFSIDRWSP